MNTLDFQAVGLREINRTLQGLDPLSNEREWAITNPMGQHAIACGLNAPLSVDIKGNVGFYCAGMNQQAEVTIHGHAGVGVAENMMSGLVRVKGNASQSAGATGHGGLLVIEGDASSRCGMASTSWSVVLSGTCPPSWGKLGIWSCAEMPARHSVIRSMRPSCMWLAMWRVWALIASKRK